MKHILSALISIICITSNAQNNWHHIYYILDSSGKEVAKRFDDSTWAISDPKKALETAYTENQQLKEKYELAMNILKLLSPTGTPKDQKKYYEAVAKFNSWK